MKLFKNPLVIASIALFAIGLLISQTVYWFKVGDGRTYTEVVKEKLTAAAAKEICAERKEAYSSDKEYRYDNTYEVTIKQSVFPTTTKSKVLLEGPLWHWTTK